MRFQTLNLLRSIAAVIVFAGAAAGECDLPEGLFAKRVAILQDEVYYAPDQTSAHALRLRAQLLDIDRTYLAIMDRLSIIDRLSDSLTEEHKTRDSAFVTECCKRAEKDPVIRLTCVMYRYLRSGKEGKSQFVDGFPHTKEEIIALWALDHITFRRTRDPTGLPTMFKPNGPSFMFMKELFNLAIAGDAEALDRFLSLNDFADGQYAEYIVDRLMVMFQKHLDLVLKHWPTIKKHPKVLASLGGYLHESTKQEILKSLQPHCKEDNPTCEYIKRIFQP